MRSQVQVNSVSEAYQRLIDGLLGGYVGERRVYAINEMFSDRVSVENWDDTLLVGQGPGWLFFIDDKPMANWAHACRYALVTESGEIRVVKAMTPPKDMSIFKEMTSWQMPPGDKGRIEESGNNAVSPRDLDRVSNAISRSVDTPASQRWAVIISGGYNAYNNHPRYYNDCRYFYETLLAHGFDENHIYVLISDGTDSAVDKSDGTNSDPDLDGDGDNDIGYSATAADINTVFDELASLLDNNDILYPIQIPW